MQAFIALYGPSMAGILFVLVAHTRRGSQCSQYRTRDGYYQLRDKLYSLFLTHIFLLSFYPFTFLLFNLLGAVPKGTAPKLKFNRADRLQDLLG